MGEKTEPVTGQELLLTLRPGSGASLHTQLETGLRDAIRDGRLPPRARVPSSRALAAELGVSRGVVLEAYGQLAAEGYLLASQGAPTRVADTALSERPPVPARSLQPRYNLDLRPGTPPLELFPRATWGRAWRLALRDAPVPCLGIGDPRGEASLRNELMAYLGRVRGAAAEPEHTLVATGFTHALAVVCRTLAERGVDRVAVESPGWPRHALVARAQGLEPIPIGTDEHGLVVGELAESDCEAVVLTPAHQFPTGAVLSAERRAALLAWAEERDGLLIEDDYDSELRYDRGAVGALQGLMPERVCHIGSLSKRLAPGIRVGWILSPSWLTGPLTYGLALSPGPGAIEQFALAAFLARGELDRHLRRIRLTLRLRWEIAQEAIRAAIPGAEPLGVPAGLHAAFTLPADFVGPAFEHAAAERGVAIETCALDGRAGLLVGFGNVSAVALTRAAERLGEVARAM